MSWAGTLSASNSFSTKPPFRGGGTNNRKNSVPDNRNEKNSNNFDRKFLQPASRGELIQKHSSGIPKLAARKQKAHLENQRARSKGFVLDNDYSDNFSVVEKGNTTIVSSSKHSFPKSHEQSGRGSNSNNEGLDSEELVRMDYHAPELFDDSKYFWREEEYEHINVAEDMKGFYDDEGQVVIEYDESDFQKTWEDPFDDDIDDDVDDIPPTTPQDAEIRRKILQFVENKEKNNIPLTTLQDSDIPEDILQYIESKKNNDDDDEFDSEDDEDEDEEDEEEDKMQRFERSKWENVDPEEQFFVNQNDLFALLSEDPDDEEKDEDSDEDFDDDEVSKTVLPLHDTGSDLDEFLEAMDEHPTNYAKVVFNNIHPESEREPIPDFPKNRTHPPLEFVKMHSRFLYVTGLPPLEVDGEIGDLSNPVHRSLLEQTISRLVETNSANVFAVSLTSGFVGFQSPKELAETLSKGPTQTYLTRTPKLSKYVDGNGGDEFFQVSPESTLLLDKIPSGNTPVSLARDLFPKGTEVGAVYGNLPPDSFYFVSTTSVLVRFASKEQAQSAIESKVVRDRLATFGKYPVRFFRARQELVHDGFSGPHKAYERRRMGPRLIVDGDMPSRNFYLTHAGVLKLSNLDPTLTKEDISRAFQPHSTLLRDISGSIEFVTCHGGHRTGQAYVGFDIAGDCEDAVEKIGRNMQLGDRPAEVKLVRERRVPNRPSTQPARRPDRSTEELVNDLTSWEQYVDPADIVELEKAGISKATLDEALRAIRFNNATFGALDSALRTEALEPQKQQGELYKELVELYIETLKECLATPENVGPLYEAMHFPDEDIDLSIFEQEKERQIQLLKHKKAD